MKKVYLALAFLGWMGLISLGGTAGLCAQEAKPSGDPSSKAGQQAPAKDAAAGPSYSGMYTFRKEGEFVQITVEDGGRVSGFISRFGDGESDKGAFLDQFFKSGKLEGNKLTFTTEIVHGVAFDFTAAVQHGEGKNPGDEAYYVLKGTLTENISDVNKKVTSHSQEVLLKMFPQEATPAQGVRK
jgi:hypothetical protein